MSSRQILWANRAKSKLIRAMGSRCWNPDCPSEAPLEIDHPHGRDWKPSKKSFSHRISIYRREWLEGKVRLLCKDCNASHRFLHVELPPPPGVVMMQEGVMVPF